MEAIVLEGHVVIGDEMVVNDRKCEDCHHFCKQCTNYQASCLTILDILLWVS